MTTKTKTKTKTAPVVETAPVSILFQLARKAGKGASLAATRWDMLGLYLKGQGYTLPAKGAADPVQEEARIGFYDGYLSLVGDQLVQQKGIVISDSITYRTAAGCGKPGSAYGKESQEYRAAAYGQVKVRAAFQSYWAGGLEAAGIVKPTASRVTAATPAAPAAGAGEVADTATAESAAPTGRSDDDQLEILLGKLQDLAERQISGQAWVQRVMPTIITGLNAATQAGDVNSSKLAAFITKTFL